MALDPLLLSRLQFAWVIAWHILLPALTIGLASYIALLEGVYFVTGKEIWFRISRFWNRIFAIAFGMGLMLALTRKRPEERMATGLPAYRPSPAAVPAE